VFEELPDQRRIFLDPGQLFIDSGLQLLATLERPALSRTSLGMAPHQLIGIEIGRIAGQKGT
jgi:hypothetical protein